MLLQFHLDDLICRSWHNYEKACKDRHIDFYSQLDALDLHQAMQIKDLYDPLLHKKAQEHYIKSCGYLCQATSQHIH